MLFTLEQMAEKHCPVKIQGGWTEALCCEPHDCPCIRDFFEKPARPGERGEVKYYCGLGGLPEELLYQLANDVILDLS